MDEQRVREIVREELAALTNQARPLHTNEIQLILKSPELKESIERLFDQVDEVSRVNRLVGINVHQQGCNESTKPN